MTRLKLPEVIEVVKNSDTLRTAHRDVNRRLNAKPAERVWSEFFNWQKDQIDDVAKTAKKRDLAIVYGAGNCRDFNLPFLADYFDRVVLVDIEEEAASIARDKLPNRIREKVEIELKDVSSCLDVLIVPARQFIHRSYGLERSFINMVAAANDTKGVMITNDGQKADFVLSTDLASTISLVPIAWLYAKFCDTFREPDVDFTRFEIAFLPYNTASFLFQLVNLSNHFDSDTIGVVTSSGVESPLVLKDGEVVPAYFTVNPQNGEKYLYYRTALGTNPRTVIPPLTQESAIALSFGYTGFGAVVQKNIFVLEHLAPETCDIKMHFGVMNEMSVVRKMAQLDRGRCSSQEIIVM